MTTVGGVILRHLDRLPQKGDSVVVEGITLTVLEMAEHRISRVLVLHGRTPGGASPDEAVGDVAAPSDEEERP